MQISQPSTKMEEDACSAFKSANLKMRLQSAASQNMFQISASKSNILNNGEEDNDEKFGNMHFAELNLT